MKPCNMPTLALLFERVISSQMYNFITPFIPQNQYGFMKGTGAQDCGATIAFIATQALNCWQELHIVSLDIKGAFDKIWWDGLLHHLWTIGVRQKAFSLLKSYLSDRYLFVVANGKESSLYPVMTGYQKVVFGHHSYSICLCVICHPSLGLVC